MYIGIYDKWFAFNHDISLQIYFFCVKCQAKNNLLKDVESTVERDHNFTGVWANQGPHCFHVERYIVYFVFYQKGGGEGDHYLRMGRDVPTTGFHSLSGTCGWGRGELNSNIP